MLSTIIAYAFLIMTGLGLVLTIVDRILARVTLLSPEEAAAQLEAAEKEKEESTEQQSEDTLVSAFVPIKSRLRLPENLLLIIACLLGGIGVTLGFFLAKRGVYKPETRLGIPAIALGETIVIFQLVPGLWDALRAILGI